MKKRTFLSLVGGGLLLAAQLNAYATAPVVTLEAARTALEQSTTTVIDIREPSEQTGGVAKGVLLIPMGQLEKRLGDLTQSKTQPLILICATQNRSAKLAEKLQTAGYTNVSYVQGGMSQWTARGWPMVKP